MRIYKPVDGADRFPQAMIEGSTEYDWVDLPDYLKEIFRQAARDFNRWADAEANPIKGELANEIEGRE